MHLSTSLDIMYKFEKGRVTFSNDMQTVKSLNINTHDLFTT